MRRLLLFLIGLIVLPLPNLIAQTELLNCPYEGRWSLSYALVFEYGDQGMPGAFARWEETGAMGFDVTCENNAASFTGDGLGTIDVVNNLAPVCSGEFEAVITGTVTETSGNFPVFNVNYAPLTYISGDCGEGGNRDLIFITSELEDVNDYHGNQITSFVLADNIPQEDVIFTIYSFDAERRYDPEVVEVIPQYMRYFIRDVPFTNLYTFRMDWDNASEPSADISVQGGEWQSLQINGDEATHLVSVQSIPVSAADFANSKVIDITMDLRFPYTTFEFFGTEPKQFSLTPDQIRMSLVDVPSWAKASDFFTITDGDHVIYKTETLIPTEPLQTPVVEIPDIIPILGGSWGLEPVQMIVTTGVHSLGTTHAEPVTGAGTLKFAGEPYDVTYGGNVWTTITNDGIQVLESPFTIALDEPVVIRDSIQLTEFVPVIDEIFHVPVLGDFLQTLFSPVSMEFEVMADVAGSGNIGVLPSGELGITEGTLDLRASGTIGDAVDIGIAWIGLFGTIGGTVELDLPDVAIKRCDMQLGITAVAGTIETGSSTFPLFTQIPLCDE